MINREGKFWIVLISVASLLGAIFYHSGDWVSRLMLFCSAVFLLSFLIPNLKGRRIIAAFFLIITAAAYIINYIFRYN